MSLEQDNWSEWLTSYSGHDDDGWIFPLICALAGLVCFISIYFTCYCTCSRNGRKLFLNCIRSCYHCCCIRCDLVTKLTLKEAVSRYQEDPIQPPKAFVNSLVNNRLVITILEALNRACPEYFFTVLPTGSLREGFGKQLPSMSVLASDYDLMLIPDAVTASNEAGANDPTKQHTPVFTVVEDPRSNPHTPNGFVWLKLEDKYLNQWERHCLRRHFGKEGCSFLSSTKINELVKSTVLSSPEVQSQVQNEACRTYGNTRIKSISTSIQQQGPALKIESYGFRKGGPCAKSERIEIFEADFLVGIHCDFWPEKALGWFSEERRVNWPSEEVVAKIKNLGIHVVPKQSTNLLVKMTLEQVEGQFSHYGQSPGLEWRYSFSQAELLLADSVPEQARSAYLAFKAVVKKHVNRYGEKMQSYALKCILFQCIEWQRKDFWDDDSFECIEVFVMLLFRSLEACLEKRNVPHFWIPELNLIDMLSYDDCHVKRQAVQRIILNPKIFIADNWLEHTRCIRLNCCYCGPRVLASYGLSNPLGVVNHRIDPKPMCICCMPKKTYKEGFCCSSPCPYQKIEVEVY